MATIAKQRLEIITPEKGTFRAYIEANSSTFKRGELVTIDAAGFVANLSGTDPAAATIAGIALHDAANSATSQTDKTRAVIWLPEPEALLVGNLGVSQTTAQTDIREVFGLVEASDLVHVDQSDTTNTRVKIIDLDSRDAVGDTNGRVVFKFLATALQLSGAVS